MVKLDTATLTSQGQVSIPKKIRERLHLQKGDRIVFLEDDNGNILIQEAETPLEFTPSQWKQFLDKSNKEPVTRHKSKSGALSHLDRLMKKK